MAFSPLVQRIADEGAAAWEIHAAAVAAARRGADVCLLSVGDPDLATPRAVTDTAVESLRRGRTHYTDVLGEPELRRAIAAQAADQTGLAIDAANVCVTAGAQNALFTAALLCLQPGDEVLVPDPCYVTYEATIRITGATPVRVSPRADSDFRPDPAALAAAITDKTKAIWLTTPNNPTGVTLTPAELDALADLARRHDLWVIADEVYAALTFTREHHSIAARPDMAARTVTVSSLSKSHAMTGWRVGWLVAPEALVVHAGNLALAMHYGLPGFVQDAAVRAIADAPDIVAENRAIYRARRDLLLDKLSAAPGIRPLCPEAGMFLMADVRATGMRGTDFAWALFREQGVSVLDAGAFGPSAEGYVRLSYTLGETRLAEAARRIAAFCEQRRATSAMRGVHG